MKFLIKQFKSDSEYNVVTSFCVWQNLSFVGDIHHDISMLQYTGGHPGVVIFNKDDESIFAIGFDEFYRKITESGFKLI